MSETIHPEGAILNAVLELPADARTAYLDKACRGDSALRERVEALMQAHEQAEGFLEAPLAHVERNRAVTAALAPTEKAGDCIGPYKLLQQIGEGGCGVVYMAEQKTPINRRVALKVIKPGMDTKQVIARFDAERQALALMDHPNIAKVLEAGATDSGRPYFVMELVRGTKITDFCDEQNLPTEERLRLFTQVCQAIQHAHQKGVIHRDIKPSNILVTINDGIPVPKVIDFGIAKATQGRLTDQTVFTAFEQFIGTPAYMSPEQAVLTSLDIDTRSDIYSLGVLLYELLTGSTPFDQKELLAVGMDEMRRTIREQEPPRPSTRLSSMAAEALTTTAKRRRTEAPKLIYLVRGDLDWVVMKCLEKDRSRRYETANGLAHDIQRHMNCEPVVARPPSKLYEFQKTLRRHKFGFAAGAAVIFVLMTGLVATSLELIRARRAEREQIRLRRIAENDEKKSEQVAKFLQDMLQGVGPSVALGRDTRMLREILDKTSERVGRDLKDFPEAEAELRYTLGDVYLEIGGLEKAEAMHRQALEIRKRVRGKEHPDIARSTQRLGYVLWRRGQYAEAEVLARGAVAMRRKQLGNESLELASALDDLSAVLVVTHGAREAEIPLREALAIQRKLGGGTNVGTLLSVGGLYPVLLEQGKYEEARQMDLEALSLEKRIFGETNPNAMIHELKHRAGALSEVHKYEEAEAAGHEAVATQRALLGREHPDVAQNLNWLADLLQSFGELQEAESLRQEALAMQRKLLGSEHKEVAYTMNKLASLRAQQHKWVEAESLCQDALAILRKVMGPENMQVAASMNEMASLLAAQRKYAEAESLRRDALAMQRKLVGSENRTVADGTASLAEVLEAQDKWAEAEPLYEQQLAISKKIWGPDDENVAQALCAVGDRFYWHRRWSKAEAKHREALAIYRKKGAEQNIARVAADLSDLCCHQGKLAEAESLARESLAIFRKAGSEQNIAWAATVLGSAIRKQNKLLEAEVVCREAMAIYLKIPNRQRLAWVTGELSAALRAQGKQAETDDVYRQVAEKVPEEGLNDLAWSLAVSPDATFRDGAGAVVFAQRAVAATCRTNYVFLDTLAAAYAETGQFQKAISAQKEAMTLMPKESDKKDFASRLKLYESHSPHREGL